MAANPAHLHAPSMPGEARVAPARAERVEIVAVTADDALLEQIGQALDGDSMIRHADSPEEARGLVSASQPGVVLLDARGFDDLAQVVGDLQSPDGTRIVVIFAPAEGSDEIARALRGSAAFAVLSIPVVPPQAAAVLEGACEEARARHVLARQVTTPAHTPDVEMSPATAAEDAFALQSPAPSLPPGRRAGPPGRTGGRKPGPVIVAGAVVLAAIAAVVVWTLQKPAVDVEPATGGPTAPGEPAPAFEPSFAPEALQAGSVDDLLEAARAAMRERRYTDPENRNAYTIYRSVLAQEPDNGEAREGLQRIAAVLQERVQTSLDEQRLDEAARTLAQLRTIAAGDPGVTRLESKVLEARARWQAEVDRRQAEERAGQLADLVSQRIRQGRLLEPANDSARHYLLQLRRLPGEAKRAEAATTELQQACLGKLREALARSQRTEVERWKAAARGLGVSAAELAAIQRDVTARSGVAESKQEGTRIAQLVQERITDGRLLEPAGDSAVFHLNALRSLDPAAAIVASSERALSAKLLEQGRFALAEQRLDEARKHAAAARQLGVDGDAVTALERDIAGSGASARSSAPPPAPKLVRTRYVAPEYPPAAFKQGLAGSVRLRLSVDAAGHVSDAVVVQADPPGVFDMAAVNAARKWRFKPIGAKGSDVQATATVEVTFQPEDDSK